MVELPMLLQPHVSEHRVVVHEHVVIQQRVCAWPDLERRTASAHVPERDVYKDVALLPIRIVPVWVLEGGAAVGDIVLHREVRGRVHRAVGRIIGPLAAKEVARHEEDGLKPREGSKQRLPARHRQFAIGLAEQVVARLAAERILAPVWLSSSGCAVPIHGVVAWERAEVEAVEQRAERAQLRRELGVGRRL
eukprot:1222841-Prymnesium_polylepis.5